MEQNDRRARRRDHKFLNGFFLIIIGLILLGQKLHAGIPGWFVSWPMFFIGLGVLMGFHSNFKSFLWIIPFIWGCFALADQQMPQLNLNFYSTPITLILLGIFFILRRDYRNQNRHDRKNDWQNAPSSNVTNTSGYTNVSDGDFIDSTSFFSGAKRVIVSKNFKGGDITCVFGGAEMDLSQADIQGTAVIDITCVFGGTKLVVPSHWNVRIEISPVFGGIEDKRIQTTAADANKTLILTGNTVFGGLEINSYS